MHSVQSHICPFCYSGILLYVFCFKVSEPDKNQFLMGSLVCIATWYPVVRLIVSARAQERAAFEKENIYQHGRKWPSSQACNACALIAIIMSVRSSTASLFTMHL